MTFIALALFALLCAAAFVAFVAADREARADLKLRVALQKDERYIIQYRGALGIYIPFNRDHFDTAGEATAAAKALMQAAAKEYANNHPFECDLASFMAQAHQESSAVAKQASGRSKEQIASEPKIGEAVSG